MTSETRILRAIQIHASRIGWRLFRNNQGNAWVGQPQRIAGTRHILLQNARRILFGVGHPGGADLIGWRPVLITPDMVGTTIAQFVAAEVKTALGRPTVGQACFIAAVIMAGGWGKVVRAESDLAPVPGPNPPVASQSDDLGGQGSL